MTAGIRAYDSAVAFACVAEVASEPCSRGRSITATGALVSPACVTSLGPGSSVAGRGCFENADCVNGYCGREVVGSCASCVAFAPEGSCCAVANPCNPAIDFCRDVVDGGVCTAWLKVGDLCSGAARCHPTTTAGCEPTFGRLWLPDGGMPRCLDFLPDGVRCSTAASCRSKYCNFTSLVPDAGPDTCGFRAVGQTCADADDCGPPNFCKGLDDIRGVLGTCTARIASGAACVTEAMDITDGCRFPETCVGGRCRSPGTLQLNEPCTSSSQCNPDLYCRNGADAGPAACASRAVNGAACSTVVPCLLESICTANICIPRLSPSGGPCRGNEGCKDLLHCLPNQDGDGGTCAAWSMAGDNCDAGTVVCANGTPSLGFCASVVIGSLVDGGQLVGRTCSNTLNLGTTCTSDTQCTSGRCVSDGGTIPGTCRMACVP